MVIVLTSAEDATADYLCDRLELENCRHLRLNTDQLLSHTRIHYVDNSPSLFFDSYRITPECVSNLWYRRPEALKYDEPNDSPEEKFILGEWSEALEGFFAHIPHERWMNHPSSNFFASHKMEQLSTASSLGLTIPSTLITQELTELEEFFKRHNGRIIAKPLSAGLVERESEASSLIYTNFVTQCDLDDTVNIFSCPTLFQQYIEKEADYRITIIDNQVHAAKMIALDEDGLQRCDVRRNNMVDVVSEPIKLPSQIESALLKLMQRYRLRFGAIDMATSVDGEWFFFEINPNGQWAWLDIASGFDIAGSFLEAFDGRHL